MSYRELGVMVRWLPQESRTQTKIRDEHIDELLAEESAEPTFGPWALLNYQIATLTDAVNALRYTTAVAGRLEGVEQPQPTPRPGMERRVRRQPEWAVAYLNRLRATG